MRAKALILVGTLALLAAAVVAGTVARASLADEPIEVTAEFESAIGLYAGSDVRVLGVKVGEVTKVTPDGEVVRVALEIDPDVRVAADTSAVIIAPTLVSDRYVQLAEPWTSGPRLASGTTIPTDRTAVPVEVDQLYDSLDQVVTLLGPEGANEDGALAELLTVGSENLRGNGDDIREVLDQLGRAAGTLSGTGDDTFAMIENFDAVARTLLDNDTHVVDVNRQLARVTRTLADDRHVLQEGLRHLAVALGQIEDFVADNRGHIDTSVRELSNTLRILVRRQESLSQMLAVAPLALQNVLRSYDPAARLLVGRGNLNDVTLWDPPPVDRLAPRLPLPLSSGPGGGTP